MNEKIKQLAEQQKQLAKEAFKVYKPEVEKLINNQNKDDNKIQLTLDYMLGFCFDSQMLILYKKLCRYYWNINPKATADYINYYREMWDNDVDNDLPLAAEQ